MPKAAEACATESTRWHANFLDLLPSIERYARIAFYRAPYHEREEARQAVVAYAALAYASLVKREKAELGYAAPLAMYGIRHHRAGRLVGGSVNVDDVSSQSCHVRRNCIVESLDARPDALAETRQTSPADLAALRIDFADWLATLSNRYRRLVVALARGESTTSVARMLSVTPGRVSQLRRELEQSWRSFTGETAPISA